MQNVFLDWGVSKSHVAIVGDDLGGDYGND